MLKLICATKCSNNHMHPQIHSQDSLHFTITLAVLHGAALPHLSHSTRKLALTLTFPDGSRRIKRSHPTPRSRAPSHPTSRPQALSRLTPWVRAPSCPTPRTRFSSRPRSQAPSRPTLRPRAPSRLIHWVRAPSRSTPRSRFPSCPRPRTLSRPTLRMRFPSRSTGSHTAANHSRSKRMGLGQNSDAREEAGTPRCNPWP